MIKVKPQSSAEGNPKAFSIECPLCKKKTKAKYQCQYCKSRWNEEQLEIRESKRNKLAEEVKSYLLSKY
ncbi:MAG: hypothetical protein IIA87_04215 [Nanoarchaeota archaeon]|nr:hypothetical protein [Nanoarchaeota archaeon]